MKNLKTAILFVLLLIQLSCKDETTQSNSLLSAKPPFDSFWFSTRFNLPSTSPSGIQDLSFYSVWSESDGNPASNQFRYDSPNNSEEIEVATNGDIIIFSTTGILNRSGDSPPPSFSGDIGLWSQTCTYELHCEIDKSSKSVISATLHIFSETFNSSYDLTTIMFFNEGEKLSSSNAPEWSIGNGEELIENVSRNHSIGIQYLFVIDDVLGTSYKN